MTKDTKYAIGLIGGTLLGLLLLIATILGISYGITDAGRAKIQALGDSARVTCYSGGKKIVDVCSTGKVHNEDSSDGYFFRMQKTEWPLEVSGDCVITYFDVCPTNLEVRLGAIYEGSR